LRKHLIGFAALAALLAPVSAQAETAGVVDLSVGQMSVEDTDLDSVGLGGSVAADLSGAWRAQFDVDATRVSESGDAVTFTNVAAHVFYDAGGWAFGGVLSNRDFGFATGWSLGAEGQVHFGPIVLEGEAGLGTIETFGGDADTASADLSGTWYATPDFSIGLGYYYFDIEGETEFDTLSLDGEYRFTNSQFSVFGGYAQTEVEDTEIDAWRIGLRYGFGEDTLQGRRQTGPRWQRQPFTIIGL
jgi:hypothetical protein